MSLPTLDALKVGHVLLTLKLPPITRYQLALYCGGSGDHNPIHVDIDFAKSAGMKDVFAHGMLSMCFMGRLITGIAPQSRVKSFGVRFVSITWVGDVITVSGRVAVIDKEQRNLTLELNCVNQRNEATLQGRAVLAL